MPEKQGRMGFAHAWNGVKTAWLQEFNFRFDMGAMVAALVLSWFFQIPKIELLIVFIVIGFVITAEVFNTALEELCDKFQPEHDPHIGKIKDLAAAAVLISSITSLVVGIVIFLPHIIAFIVW